MAKTATHITVDGERYDLQDKELAQDVSDLKSALNGTVYQITWTDDAILRQNGTVSTSAQEGVTGRCVSNYILCKDATKAMVCCESNNPYIGSVCFYDENKSFISYLKQIGTNYVPVEINIPSGAYYARISSQIAYKSVSFLYCEEPVVLLLTESNTKAINGKQDKPVYTPQEYDYTNYLLLVEQYEGYEWTGLSGTPYLNAKANSVATSMVMLDRTKPLASSNVYTGYALFYDESGDYISSKAIYYLSPIQTTDYPASAVYVAFSLPTTNHTSFYRQVCTEPLRLRSQNKIGSYAASTIIKKKNERPIIHIYTTDSETTILQKLLDAYVTRDCDVYWEHGTYIFTDVWDFLYTTVTARNYLELYVGGNCRYYFNGSKLVSNINNFYTAHSGFASCTINLLSQGRKGGQSFELFDVFIETTGLTYSIHDEGSSSELPYLSKYHNVHIKHKYDSRNTSALQKCIGGGTGLKCEVVIENCSFETEYNGPDVSFHGAQNSSESGHFDFEVYGSYFGKCISLDVLGTNQSASCLFEGNSWVTDQPSRGTEGSTGSYNWFVRAWNNRVRE